MTREPDAEHAEGSTVTLEDSCGPNIIVGTATLDSFPQTN